MKFDKKNPTKLQGAFGRLDPTGSWTEKLYDVLPVGRLGEIPEIANLATYMVSDYSSWMTGEVRKSNLQTHFMFIAILA